MMLLVTAAAWTAIATIVLAGATLIVAGVAAFQDQIRDRLYHPFLNVSVNNAPPESLSIPLVWQPPQPQWISSGATMSLPPPIVSSDCVYLRLRLWATGRPARDVEVFAQELQRKDKSGNWKRVTTFLPMNLIWADFGRAFLPLLNPGIDHFCDLGRTVDPASRPPSDDKASLGLSPTTASLHFSTAVDPTQQGNIVEPGEYRLRIAVAASNAPAITRTVEVAFDGTWYSDETKMLSHGVGVRIVA